jgi:hypothetical protein
MKKLTSIVAGVVLFFMSGCSSLSSISSSLTPNQIPTPYKIVDPIFPKKETKIPYEEIEQREKIIADSLEKNFPNGLVICLEGKSIEEERYVVLKLEDKARTLISTFYKFPYSKIKEELCDFYLFNKNNRRKFFDINAQQILEEGGYQSRMVVNDFKMNGLRESESEDYITFRNQGEKESILRKGTLTIEGELIKNENFDNLLLESNLLLRDYLKELTSKLNKINFKDQKIQTLGFKPNL